MAVQPPASGTLGEVLASRRGDRFVGREAERALFRAALSGDASERVLFIHGSAGRGKTALLEELGAEAAQRGAAVVRLDGHELIPSPAALVDALKSRSDVADDAGATGHEGRRLVLLVDDYERFAPVDRWVHDELVPSLPADALVVLASRTPPAPAWATDLGVAGLLHVVELGDLGAGEARAYLERCGVPAAVHAHLLRVTYGNPLALALVTDLVLRGGDPPGDRLGPDLVGALVRRFVDVAPDQPQRDALAACAVARVTDEPLLRAVVQVDDAHELLDWLRQLSFVESAPDGVRPHDLARDVLDADLRWRDGERYREVFRRVAEHTRGRMRAAAGRSEARAVSDLKFVFRHVPSVLSPVDWDSWGQHHPEPARHEDRDAVLALIADAEGKASAEIAAGWYALQPGGFSVLRDGEVVRGVVVLLDLTEADAVDRERDPGARAAWDHVQRHGPPRAGERVTQTRFVVDRDAYQGPSPTLNAVPLLTLRRQLATPRLAWDYLALHEPEPWDEFFELADLHRARDADFTVGGRRYGLFAHDFRAVPVDDLIDLWVERALAQDPTLTPSGGVTAPVLSERDFADAVRQGLRDLHRPDLLERNPLTSSRLVRAHLAGGADAATALDRLLRDGVDTLRRHPRDDKLLRAVERTYLDPATTQEAAAARLGLPFSTYRRHLTQGVARVVAWLWEQELDGGGRGRS